MVAVQLNPDPTPKKAKKPKTNLTSLGDTDRTQDTSSSGLLKQKETFQNSAEDTNSSPLLLSSIHLNIHLTKEAQVQEDSQPPARSADDREPPIYFTRTIDSAMGTFPPSTETRSDDAVAAMKPPAVEPAMKLRLPPLNLMKQLPQ